MMQEAQDFVVYGLSVHVTGKLFTATTLIRMRKGIRISSFFTKKIAPEFNDFCVLVNFAFRNFNVLLIY
jgi:DNA primase